MTKCSLMVTLMIGISSGLAGADAKSDAQAKVDAAKTETCEKSKKFLGDQAAKGRCTAESADAQKVSCSASTAKQVFDLQTKCLTAPSKSTKVDSPPATVGGTRCRGLDVADRRPIVEVEDKSRVKCAVAMTQALKKHWCTAANKGKKFDYISDFDHVIGKGRFATRTKPRKSTLTCYVVAK